MDEHEKLQAVKISQEMFIKACLIVNKSKRREEYLNKLLSPESEEFYISDGPQKINSSARAIYRRHTVGISKHNEEFSEISVTRGLILSLFGNSDPKILKIIENKEYVKLKDAIQKKAGQNKLSDLEARGYIFTAALNDDVEVMKILEPYLQDKVISQSIISEFAPNIMKYYLENMQDQESISKSEAQFIQDIPRVLGYFSKKELVELMPIFLKFSDKVNSHGTTFAQDFCEQLFSNFFIDKKSGKDDKEELSLIDALVILDKAIKNIDDISKTLDPEKSKKLKQSFLSELKKASENIEDTSKFNVLKQILSNKIIDDILQPVNPEIFGELTKVVSPKLEEESKKIEDKLPQEKTHEFPYNLSNVWKSISKLIADLLEYCQSFLNITTKEEKRDIRVLGNFISKGRFKS